MKHMKFSGLPFLAFALIIMLAVFGCASSLGKTEKKEANASNSPADGGNNGGIGEANGSINARNGSSAASEAQANEEPMTGLLECEKIPLRAQKEECYDRFIKAKLNFKAPKDLIAELDSAANSDATLRLACHDIAHAVGRQAYYVVGNDIPKAFNLCVQTCHSGCFHGIIQAAFLGDDYQSNQSNYESHLTIPEMKDKIRAACTSFSGNVRNNFQCLHGLGHAILFYVENDLELSLEICDSLDTFYARSSCYGGAFMENAVSINTASRRVRHNDTLYPCSVLDEKYKYECYQMQTSVMLEILGDHADKIISACKNAEVNYTHTCFKSFGRDRSSSFRVNIGTVFDDIKLIPAEYRMDYIRGTSYALVDNTWNGYYAFQFCSKIDNSELKAKCYAVTTEYMGNNLGIYSVDVMQSCQSHAPPQDIYLCQHGI